ncbi:hypothetical protein RC86_11640 [Pectobacterium brasiliense]|uniref:hypothetical protein n=1 Tax=Pectobacterium brasiliense TaxID=180957 RepID=UPI000580940D|nr:hypothetical protein [Pectobacterium brasiliense]KHS91187.1 hypothetical protein RC86_11640 [Pectobacterium brasiliense]
MTEADLDELADEIVLLFTTGEFYRGIGSGIGEVSKNFGYLTYSFLDTDTRYARSREMERMIRAIHRGILSRDKIYETVKRIFDSFNKHTSESQKRNIYHGAAGAMTGSVIVSQVVLQLATRIGNLASIPSVFSYYILLGGGMAERSIYRSRSLSTENPEVYYALRKDDLDFLFFLIEPMVEPIMESLKIKRIYGDHMFNALIDKVGEKIKSHA